jgi:RHS repeat-associated protein
LTHNNGTEDVAFYDYLYDAANRITKITDVDGVTDYTYDDRNQLIGADHSNDDNPDESYSYDANGNRIESSIHGDGYQTGDGNRLLSDGTYNYEYDNEGNLIRRTEIATDNVREFEWDYHNRLVAVIDKDADGNETQRVEFTYDAFDRRISKAVNINPEETVDEVVTYFIYNASDVYLEFVDPDGTSSSDQPVLEQRYLHGPGVDQILAQDNGDNNVLWHLSDHHKSIRDLVDNNGTLVNHSIYNSFGSLISESDSTFNTRYLFTGREFDEETDFYYYRARYYNQTTGRFLNEDLIGFGGNDSNLYRYVGNEPVSNTDSTGLILDTIVDVGFILYDLYRIAKDNVFGDCDNLGENLGALGADVLGAALPFATGGGLAVRGATHADDLAKAANRLDDAADFTHASTPVGRKGSPLNVIPGTNQPATIGGREYSGHALDRMQERGLTPSVVENTINHGQSIPGKIPGTTAHYDPVNHVTVITDTASGRVVTTAPGQIKQ